jgi:hypothetical protein
MSVTVDQEPLAAEELGLQTVGQVLSHLQRDNRLVVNLLIDGAQPDLSEISRVRQSLVRGKTLFIETAQPRQMALEVLDEVESQLGDAENFKRESAEFLRKNQIAKAMEKLGLCFTHWQTAQESVLKVAQLLRIDLNLLCIDGNSLAGILENFTAQLRQIKEILVERDFVALTDILMYEMTETRQCWIAALDALRRAIAG